MVFKDPLPRHSPLHTAVSTSLPVQLPLPSGGGVSHSRSRTLRPVPHTAVH